MTGEKNVFYVDVKIINYLDAQGIFQKNAVAINNMINLKDSYLFLGPDLS